MRSGINKLYRHIDTLQRSIPQQISQSQRGTSIPRSGKTGDGVVICCVNATGEILESFMCVKVENGGDTKDPPTIVFPEIDDVPELALYGSVLNSPAYGEDAFVQISGKMIFRIAKGSQVIMVGEMLYPLENKVGTKGRVGNIASGLDDLIEGGPLGRSLTLEDSTTELVEVIPTSKGAVNSSLSITIDGGGSVISSTNPTLGGATVEVPYNCDIINWTVESDVSGSIVVDITRANKAVPSISIVGGGNKPTLATAQYASAEPSGWTSLDLVKGDIIGFAISGTPTTVKRVTVTLRVVS